MEKNLGSPTGRDPVGVSMFFFDVIEGRKVASMAKVKHGDKVRVHYKGTLKNGSEFDNSAGKDPIEFTVGEGRVIPGFEKAVVGMTAGESKTVTVPVDDAYGKSREELLLTVERNTIPPDLDPVVGDDLVLEQEDRQIHVRVIEVTEELVTLDANHPLVGEDLFFEIELVEVV
jgi:peptidylprolyl isomerase